MDIEAKLKALGFKVAYRCFAKAVSPPFVTYYETSSDYSGADYEIYFKDTDYVIELYTIEKDKSLEKIIEDWLTSEGIAFKTNDSYIKEEKTYLRAYYLTLNEII